MGMNKVKTAVVAGVFTASAFLTVGSASAAPKKFAGDLAYDHVVHLTEEIGPRVAGSKNETIARQYILNELEKLDLEVKEQKFNYTRRGVTSSSANAIGVKDNPKTNKQIIVGAHYDSVSAGKGADDNASSVGVILETAKALDKRNLPYDIKYVFFGAEEEGLQGSNYYANNMTDEEIENTIGMINLDSLLAGDNIYVYGGAGEDGWIRDLALKIADQRKIPLQTNPGINPKYPKGTTGDWSDHAPFKGKGITIAYLEATNWELGDQDGYTQTEKHGGIWHTKNDNLEFLEKEFPGRTKEHLNQFTNILTQLLTDIKKEL
ncbi:M20/M25/M40 family metallo-hydrolase [Mesobacillus maritimus]|uniref:M20/M25/M40 family metallo-hydrolase n=1 Tax=Mesobacillus maritimus TaxID=1643336 RepID=A0ABS7KBM2_9BACI|nr:M20/M25/M40 family metallo-hydrolase [Mesobacillus maritimus]MBY0099672.1 M20/M25/M40 family metallo-hydrolase [Mesobacillus maritimus]